MGARHGQTVRPGPRTPTRVVFVVLLPVVGRNRAQMRLRGGPAIAQGGQATHVATPG